MKNIIVFTDYSKQCDHATKFAIHLAKKIKANILMVEAVSTEHRVLSLNFAGVNVGFEDHLPEQNERLRNMCNVLENELTENALPGKFLPAIYCQRQLLPVNEALMLFEESLEIAFTVCAANLYYSSSSIIAGKICGQLLESAISPVILVPESAPVRYAEKYAFMADLTSNNVFHLTETSKLAELSAAELMVVNINNGRPLDKDQEIAVKTIMRETTHQIDYGRIYYRHLPNSVLKSDLEWLFQDNRFEALVMVYRKNSILNQVLRFDYTDKLIGNIDVPLVIYPAVE